MIDADTPIGLVPVEHFPLFAPVAHVRRLEQMLATVQRERMQALRRAEELADENARLRRQLAEAQQRPLVAVVAPEPAASPAPVNGRYTCSHCDKTFFAEEFLTRHIARHHA